MTLVKADGTALSKTPGGTVLEPQAETDPRVKVLIPVYKETPYPGTNYPTQERQLAFRAGQIIPQSEWDAQYTAAKITKVAPATGPAAGGTVITITGDGFAEDSTVQVGGVAATAVTVNSGTMITATTPAGAAGAADVTVTAPGPVTVTRDDGFTYT
jgi:hypothetical protein